MKNEMKLKAGAAAVVLAAMTISGAAGQTTPSKAAERPAGTATPPATKTPQPARTQPEMRPVGAAEGQNPPVKARITPEELEKMKAERAKMAAERAQAGGASGGAAPTGRASMLEDLKVYRFAVEVQDYESAVRALCAFVAKNPQLNNYRDTLAALYIRNGQYTSALATLKKKTATGDDRYGQELRVRSLIGLERYDEAQSALTPLLEKEKSFTAEFDQALIHLHRKKYDEALKILNSLAARKDAPALLDFVSAENPGIGTTPAVLAYAKGLAEKGAGKNAAAAFAESIKLDPDFKPARDAARQ